jgi:hypothetical protein
MSDRFELEDRITKFHMFSDLIRDLCTSTVEHDLSVDEITNGLEGIAVLIDNHAKITFDIFTQVLGLD